MAVAFKIMVLWDVVPFSLSVGTIILGGHAATITGLNSSPASEGSILLQNIAHLLK
jgi:hypothetical protein